MSLASQLETCIVLHCNRMKCFIVKCQWAEQCTIVCCITNLHAAQANSRACTARPAVYHIMKLLDCFYSQMTGNIGRDADHEGG